MTLQAATRIWTWDDYENLPDEEGKHYEIIEGELFVNASPVPRHQRIVRNLLFELELYFRQQGGGEVLQAPIGVVINQINVVEPDLVVPGEQRRVDRRTEADSWRAGSRR